jgi:hypothetical protein
MKTNQRILEVRNKIVEHHGRLVRYYYVHSIYRIDNIRIYDKDPSAVVIQQSSTMTAIDDASADLKVNC